MLHIDGRVHGCERRIGRINRTGFAFDFDIGAARTLGGKLERKLRSVRKIGSGEIHFGINAGLLAGIDGADHDFAVLDFESLDAQRAGSGISAGLAGGSGAAEAGIIPFAAGPVNQGHVWAVDGDRIHINLFVEDQRNQFDADGQRFRGKKGRLAESRIVRDGDVRNGDAAGENGELDVADSDLAAQRGTEFGFDGRLKLVGVDEQRQTENDEQK